MVWFGMVYVMLCYGVVWYDMVLYCVQIACPAVDTVADVNFTRTRHAVHRQTESPDGAGRPADLSDTEQSRETDGTVCVCVYVCVRVCVCMCVRMARSAQTDSLT